MNVMLCFYMNVMLCFFVFMLNQMFSVTYQWIRLIEFWKKETLFTNFKSFSEFWNKNRKFWPKNRKKFKSIARREYLIKLQCVIYQWIWLDMLYKLMWSFFFLISESFFELVTFFNSTFFNNSGVGFMQARWGRHLCWTARFLVIYIFSMYGFIT